MLDILIFFYVLFVVLKKSLLCNVCIEFFDLIKLINFKNEKKELIYKLYCLIYNCYGLLMIGFE